MMGASATVEEDPRAVLVAVLATATEAANALDGTPGSGDEASSPHAIRRRLDGCTQALERIAAMAVDASLHAAGSGTGGAPPPRIGPRWEGCRQALKGTPGRAADPSLHEARSALEGAVDE